MDRLVQMASEIAGRGWSRRRDIFTPSEIADLAAAAQAVWREQSLHPAAVGRGAALEVRSDVRGDYIRWLDRSAPSPAEARFWERVDELRRALNRELFLGLHSVEAHYAAYPPGAFYRRHLDRFLTSDERMISMTLYLNQDWRAEDGGELRLHLPEGEVEIAPEAGTFVLFRSDEVWHEVRPAARLRLSLTGWLRRRPLGGVLDLAEQKD